MRANIYIGNCKYLVLTILRRNVERKNNFALTGPLNAIILDISFVFHVSNNKRLHVF